LVALWGHLFLYELELLLVDFELVGVCFGLFDLGYLSVSNWVVLGYESQLGAAEVWDTGLQPGFVFEEFLEISVTLLSFTI